MYTTEMGSSTRILGKYPHLIGCTHLENVLELAPYPIFGLGGALSQPP